MRQLIWAIPIALAVGLGLAYLSSRGSRSPTGSGAKLLVFVQPNCPPCSRSRQELATAPVSAKVQWVNIRQEPEMGRSWGINETPTYALLDANGHEVSRRVGYQSREELLAWVRSTR